MIEPSRRQHRLEVPQIRDIGPITVIFSRHCLWISPRSVRRPRIKDRNKGRGGCNCSRRRYPHPPSPSGLVPPLPRCAGLSGENSATEQEGNRPNNFVLAGLGPAIHALEKPKQRRGCADQVRARRLGGDMSVYNPLLLQEKFPRTALRGAGEELRAECVV
jgi:hypothetical protein